MRIGTRSLLFGSHQFLLHPIFVALGWRHCYGRLPRDLRVWVAIVVHDWGYWGSPNMDGPEGQMHPEWAAKAMYRWFGEPWGDFAAGHSRYYARACMMDVSPLMRPDKMATVLMPFWLYVTLAWLSGEYKEYVGFHRAAGFEVDGLLSWARSIRKHWRERYGREAGALWTG